jgi:hypothetical protein
MATRTRSSRSARSPNPRESKFKMRPVAPVKSQKTKTVKAGAWPSVKITERMFKSKDADKYGEPLLFSKYTTKAQPCSPKGKESQLRPGKCKVQLIWKSGSPFLRVCRTAKKPGPLIPVRSASDARKRSNELCACFLKTKASGGEASWKRFTTECLGSNKLELGGVKKRSKRKGARRG